MKRRIEIACQPAEAERSEAQSDGGRRWGAWSEQRILLSESLTIGPTQRSFPVHNN